MRNHGTKRTKKKNNKNLLLKTNNQKKIPKKNSKDKISRPKRLRKKIRRKKRKRSNIKLWKKTRPLQKNMKNNLNSSSPTTLESRKRSSMKGPRTCLKITKKHNKRKETSRKLGTNWRP
jgi:hypothetical protein